MTDREENERDDDADALRIAKALRSFSQPPRMPREDIWAAIVERDTGTAPRRWPQLRIRPTLSPGFALAAASIAFAAGMSIGFVGGRRSNPTIAVEVASAVVHESRAASPMREAQHIAWF
jgi:hypothetical protein